MIVDRNVFRRDAVGDAEQRILPQCLADYPIEEAIIFDLGNQSFLNVLMLRQHHYEMGHGLGHLNDGRVEKDPLQVESLFVSRQDRRKRMRQLARLNLCQQKFRQPAPPLHVPQPTTFESGHYVVGISDD